MHGYSTAIVIGDHVNYAYMTSLLTGLSMVAMSVSWAPEFFETGGYLHHAAIRTSRVPSSTTGPHEILRSGPGNDGPNNVTTGQLPGDGP